VKHAVRGQILACRPTLDCIALLLLLLLLLQRNFIYCPAGELQRSVMRSSSMESVLRFALRRAVCCIWACICLQSRVFFTLRNQPHPQGSPETTFGAGPVEMQSVVQNLVSACMILGGGVEIPSRVGGNFVRGSFAWIAKVDAAMKVVVRRRRRCNPLPSHFGH